MSRAYSISLERSLSTRLWTKFADSLIPVVASRASLSSTPSAAALDPVLVPPRAALDRLWQNVEARNLRIPLHCNCPLRSSSHTTWCLPRTQHSTTQFVHPWCVFLAGCCVVAILMSVTTRPSSGPQPSPPTRACSMSTIARRRSTWWHSAPSHAVGNMMAQVAKITRDIGTFNTQLELPNIRPHRDRGRDHKASDDTRPPQHTTRSFATPRTGALYRSIQTCSIWIILRETSVRPHFFFVASFCCLSPTAFYVTALLLPPLLDLR